MAVNGYLAINDRIKGTWKTSYGALEKEWESATLEPDRTLLMATPRDPDNEDWEPRPAVRHSQLRLLPVWPR